MMLSVTMLIVITHIRSAMQIMPVCYCLSEKEVPYSTDFNYYHYCRGFTGLIRKGDSH
ncbi:MAG: hypothetical protein Kow0099_12020 [Candidatus Abyssubacteria bacterium]